MPGTRRTCSTSCDKLIFFVNGKKIVEENPNPEWTLLYYLRTKLRLCGTKLGCAEGGCGACTVMVSKYDRKQQRIIHLPVNACLAPVCSMHGLAVTTVEGIGSTKTKLHPVQERIAKAHGSQCGFCTPGIVMSMYSLLRNMPKPSMKDMEIAFQGNLCRCTGYRPIIEAYKTFTENWEVMQNGKTGCAMGDKCCKLNGGRVEEKEELFKPNEFTPYDSSQEPIFPPELKLREDLDQTSLCFKGEEVTWYRPRSLEELVGLKKEFNGVKIVVGNTEIGVETKFKKVVYPILVQPTIVPELIQWKFHDDGLKIGAAVTLDNLEQLLKTEIQTLPSNKTRIFKAIVEMLQWFGGKQIRSVAAIGGNIMTGSPISDLNPILIAAEVQLEVASCDGKRFIKMDENFFTSYRKNVLKDEEVLVSINLPYSKENQYFYAHKQARRRDDDISIVNSALSVVFREGSLVIEDFRMVFGGMGPTTKTVPNKELIGLTWNESTLEKAYSILLNDLPLDSGAPGGMVEYRRTLPLSFLFRSYITISRELQKAFPSLRIDSRDLSAIDKFSYKSPKSSQFFQIISPEKQPIVDTVGRPVVHQSAEKQVTGEAVYFDDLPHFENELYLGLVFSKKAHANIISIDPKKALEIPGVVGFISAEDIEEGRNKLGCIVEDEEVFVTKTTTAQYQLLGGIVAENQIIAQKAANKVEVNYEELQPVIVSIEDAIKHESFFPQERKIEVGNVDEIFNKTENIVQGECRTGYQEHFYLETHGCLVVNKEDELEIFASSQHHAEITDFVSRVLNIPQNRVVTRIKRIGGGFGGKESRGVPIALAAALACKKFKRPVRIMLDRDEDMAMTGGRHPYLVKYKAAFDKEGRILAYDAMLYANGGYSNDLSLEVLQRAVFHIENSIKIPNLRVIGKICRTNLPTNTAFRGFGAPQAMFAAENMMRDVAEVLQKDPLDLYYLNLYQEGDKTHYNQQLVNCNLKKCLDECVETSQYHKRKQDVENYNKENRWKKKGISIVCTKYAVGFGVPFLEQAGALVNVYTDGSVLLTHGGVEMGQGIITKMIQVASRVLEIPIDRIYTSDCSTDKVPNTSSSAASVCSDLNGMAVLRACNVIKERLKPIIDANPKGSWNEWIKAAYFERISLSATGFFCTPDIYYDWETNSGKPYNYFTYGVACTEVEVDCLTGDHQVLRTDIVMDLGKSLNPAIDIGQVEGGFMQGYGLFVLEEMIYSPTGTILSKGPGAYKIPGFSNIPIEFNVSLLKGTGNPKAVYSSKAVGEPPLFLASSALFAIREAVKSAREDSGNVKEFRLNAPATSEKIRMACQDHLTKKVDKCKSTWNVVP